MKASLFFLTIVLLALPAAAADDEDVVVVASDKYKSGQRKMKGRIVRYTGDELLLRQLSGREVPIPSDRVIEIQSAWLRPHALGDGLLAAGKFDEALGQYRQAVRQEKRHWVRQRILVQVIWCYRGQGKLDLACDEFLNLQKSDPPPQYFAAIPLGWRGQPPPEMARRAGDYLKSSSSVTRLIGASWLLPTNRIAAGDVLQQLTIDRDKRVALLAEAQLWRTRIVTANDDDLKRWERMLQRIPVALRGGPYYTLGRGLAQRNHHEQAALILMRTPIFYARDRTLAADALLATAVALEKLDRPNEAGTLYHELLTQHRSSSAASQAESRLRNLPREKTK